MADSHPRPATGAAVADADAEGAATPASHPAGPPPGMDAMPTAARHTTAAGHAALSPGAEPHSVASSASTGRPEGVTPSGDGDTHRDIDHPSLPRSTGAFRATRLSPEPTPEDEAIFRHLVNDAVPADSLEGLAQPVTCYPGLTHVLAIHWHPQHIPLSVARRRLAALFPDARDMLVIPTEHNVLHVWDGFAGVEADCRDFRLGLKVQLLLHFREERVREAHTLRSMLRHTALYRGIQLRDLLETAAYPDADGHRHRVERAVRATGSGPEVIEVAAAYAAKLLTLLDAEGDTPTTDERRSTLLRDFAEAMRPTLGPVLTPQVHAYTKALRDRVKAEFPLDFFHDARAFMEEARALGGLVTIPHPEQFWPILLAGYDVDAIEVWNPQSRRHTNFLISVVREANERRAGSRPTLVMMGDDTHCGEMLRLSDAPERPRPAREIGVQPLWEDPVTLKELEKAGMTRPRVIEAFRQRLGH